MPIHEIGTILKKQIGELLKLLHEKMSTGDNNVKDAWKGLSEAEDSVKDIAKVIERHEEQLVILSEIIVRISKVDRVSARQRHHPGLTNKSLPPKFDA